MDINTHSSHYVFSASPTQPNNGYSVVKSLVAFSVLQRVRLGVILILMYGWACNDLGLAEEARDANSFPAGRCRSLLQAGVC